MYTKDIYIEAMQDAYRLEELYDGEYALITIELDPNEKIYWEVES